MRRLAPLLHNIKNRKDFGAEESNQHFEKMMKKSD
jgi:hypothetical protein